MGRVYPTNVYIVLEQGYEYNDEISYPAGDGSPGNVYGSEEAANDAADGIIIDMLADQPLSDYCYTLDEMLNWEWHRKLPKDADAPALATIEVQRILGDPTWTYESKMYDLTRDQLIELRQYLNVKFAWVEERVIQ